MATLELTSLYCERQQDLSGVDEPRITVDNREVWKGAIDKGGLRILTPTNVTFTGNVVVRLDEMNGDNPKNIGGDLIVRDTGAGPQPHDFKTSGAWYKLSYRVR